MNETAYREGPWQTRQVDRHHSEVFRSGPGLEDAILIPSADFLTCKIVEDFANALEYLRRATDLSGVQAVATAALARARRPEISYLH